MKDHNDSLIAQVNSKTVENADLKAQIQEKVFANAALKNELRKLKGKSVDTNETKTTLRFLSLGGYEGRIFKLAGLRWIPTRKLFDSCTSKVDSEPPNGSNDDITNPYECNQTLNVSACTLNLSACLTLQRQMASADNTLDLSAYEDLFQPLFDEYFNPPPCAVSPDPVAVAAPRPVDPAGSPLSTTIDQDVPSASTSPTNQEIQFQVTHQGVEE
ncbi:hypothetical protein Tco_1458867 [Tanacetum coccineum]